MVTARYVTIHHIAIGHSTISNSTRADFCDFIAFGQYVREGSSLFCDRKERRPQTQHSNSCEQ
jgi:hypothetical protein